MVEVLHHEWPKTAPVFTETELFMNALSDKIVAQAKYYHEVKNYADVSLALAVLAQCIKEQVIESATSRQP